MMEPTVRRAAIAYHEAGHAVIARVLGLVGGYVSIFGDSSAAGHTLTDDPWSMLDRWDAVGKHRSFYTALHARIISYMAGAEAEVALLGSAEAGDTDDRRQIDLMLHSLDLPENRIKYYDIRLRDWTKTLVRRHQRCISFIASRILEHNYLSGGEIDRIVEQFGR